MSMKVRLQQMLSDLGEMRSTRLAMIFALLAALVVTVYATRRYAFYRIVESYALEIGRVFNLNVYFVSSVIWALITICFALSFLVLHSKRAYRNAGTLIACIGLAVYFIVLGFGYSSAPILASRCYTITENGVEYLELYDEKNEKIDPRSGRECFKITPEILPILRRYESGERPITIAYDSGQQDFFHRLTGEAITWYSIGNGGRIVMYNLMGFDPVTGERLTPVTMDIVDAWHKQAQAEKQPERIAEPEEFFDAKGNAVVWYHRGVGNEINFFDAPGFDPVSGGQLRMVTPEIVAEYLDAVRRARAELEEERNRKPPTRLTGEIIFFGPEGQPLVWYFAKSDEDFEFFDRPGHHPVFGRELQAVTTEIVKSYMSAKAKREAEAKQHWAELEEKRKKQEEARKLAARCKDRTPKRLTGEVVFFSSTGEPLVWYYRPVPGKIELFDCDGFHPIYGERLQPVSRKVAGDYQYERQLQLQQEEAEKKRQAEERRLEEEQRLAALKAGDDCDRMAGNPTDPRRNAGIRGAPYAMLRSQAERAIEICKLATIQWPDELRYKYQLARARQTISRNAAYAELVALANAGYPAAHDNIGWIVFQRGRNQYPRAKSYFEKGARLGDPDSMVSLSRLLVSGQVGPRDIDTAIFWLRKAAEMGHPDAQELLFKYEEEKRKGELALGIFLNVLGNIIRK
jgi:hypothetical protein